MLLSTENEITPKYVALYLISSVTYGSKLRRAHLIISGSNSSQNVITAVDSTAEQADDSSPAVHLPIINV